MIPLIIVLINFISMKRIVIKIKQETTRKIICIKVIYFCFSLLNFEVKLNQILETTFINCPVMKLCLSFVFNGWWDRSPGSKLISLI